MVAETFGVIYNSPVTVTPSGDMVLDVYKRQLYNMGSGILRAVGDSRRPFYFLLVSAVLNTGLDLLFVLKFGMGVEMCIRDSSNAKLTTFCWQKDAGGRGTSALRGNGADKLHQHRGAAAPPQAGGLTSHRRKQETPPHGWCFFSAEQASKMCIRDSSPLGGWSVRLDA